MKVSQYIDITENIKINLLCYDMESISPFQSTLTVKRETNNKYHTLLFKINISKS